MPHARPPATNMMPPPIKRAGDSAADAIEQHQRQQRRGEPHRLRSQADAERREERADHDHSARTRRSRPAPFADRRPGPGLWIHQADIRHACEASATARPGRSLIGRTPRYQNNGHDAVIAVAAKAT